MNGSHRDVVNLRTSGDFGGFNWTIEYRGPYSTNGIDMAEDTSGNLYLLASSLGRILVKYNSEGSFIWNKTIFSVGEKMVIDSADNLYIAGNNYSDICLIKYNINGNKQWIRTWDSGLIDNIKGITLDSFGNVYITGQANYNSSVVGSGDMVVLKYNSTGHLLLNKTWGKNNLLEQAESVVVDSNNNIYLAGWYKDPSTEWILVKLNLTGDYQWNSTYVGGGPRAHITFDAILDSNDNIYLVGVTDLSGLPSTDVSLIKLNNLGYYGWNATWDNGLSENGRCIAIDSKDNIFIAGQIRTGDPDNDYDALLLKYDIDGNQIWNTTWERIYEWAIPGYWDDSFNEIFVSPIDNDVYLVGTSNVGPSENNATIVKLENTPPEMIPTLTVTTPNRSNLAEGRWIPGMSYCIYWNSTGNISNVEIELWNETLQTPFIAFVRDINVSTINDGEYNWTVPLDIKGWSPFYIKIIDVSNPTTYDFSEKFAIYTPVESDSQNIPGYNIFFLLGIFCVVSILLFKNRNKSI